MDNTPASLDEILARAADDEQFLQELLDRRSAALDEAGLNADATVRSMLDRIPREQIARQVEAVRTARKGKAKPLARPSVIATALGVGAAAAMFCMPTLGSSPDRAYINNAFSNLKQVHIAQEMYHKENGKYVHPTDLELRQVKVKDFFSKLFGEGDGRYVYTFELTETGFRATAVPVHRKQPRYSIVVDETGAVRAVRPEASGE